MDVVKTLSKLSEGNARLHQEVEVLRLNAQRPDELDVILQHLQKQAVALLSVGDNKHSYVPGIIAFREVAKATSDGYRRLGKIANVWIMCP